MFKRTPEMWLQNTGPKKWNTRIGHGLAVPGYLNQPIVQIFMVINKVMRIYPAVYDQTSYRDEMILISKVLIQI